MAIKKRKVWRFNDLQFGSGNFGGIMARKTFKNGYGVSVIDGEFSYSGDDNYEMALLYNGEVEYDEDKDIPNGVEGYLSESEITDLMIKIQNYDKK